MKEEQQQEKSGGEATAVSVCVGGGEGRKSAGKFILYEN